MSFYWDLTQLSCEKEISFHIVKQSKVIIKLTKSIAFSYSVMNLENKFLCQGEDCKEKLFSKFPFELAIVNRAVFYIIQTLSKDILN